MGGEGRGVRILRRIAWFSGKRRGGGCGSVVAKRVYREDYRKLPPMKGGKGGEIGEGGEYYKTLLGNQVNLTVTQPKSSDPLRPLLHPAF